MLLIFAVERLHCRHSGLGGVDILPSKHLLDGRKENLQVHLEADVPDVIDVILKLLCPADVVAAVDLRPTAHSGGDIVAVVLLLAVEREVLHQQRTGADEGHIALEEVDQLRQFVNRGGADKLAHLGQTVGIGKELALGIPLVRHCLELQSLENLLILPRTVLSEENALETVLVGKEQQHHRPQHKGAQNNDSHQCPQESDGTLDEADV